MNRTLVIILVLATIAGGIFTLTQTLKYFMIEHVLSLCDISFKLGTISEKNALGCVSIINESNYVKNLLLVGVSILITGATSLIIYVAHSQTSKNKDEVKPDIQ